MAKKTQFHSEQSFLEEERRNRARIFDIKNKIEWKTATFAEKNIYNIYIKRQKKNVKNSTKNGSK